MDEDDECMESDFRTLQKEEYRSTRAGMIYLTFIFYVLIFLKMCVLVVHLDMP